MTSLLSTIGSVALTEGKLRFRRTSTWVLFVFLCLVAFLLMPAVGSNSVMFLIGRQRVLLNSAATALTSAILGGFVLSLFGFYFVSDSVTRDLRSGVGRLIGPAPIPSATYLFGKFLGNTLFLYAISFIFMCACMAVHLLRGEAPLEPLVFARTFALMFLPMAPSVAGLALTFECVPFLSGRIGDALYFFCWVLLLALPAALIASEHGRTWVLGFDVTGIGYFIPNVIRVTGSSNFTIGYAPYDATLSPVLFRGLDLDPTYVVPRLCSALMALPLLGIAFVAFRRFDPAFGKTSGKRQGFLTRFQEHLTTDWLRRFLPRLEWLGGPPGVMKSVILDAHLTFVLTPILIIVMIALSLTTILVPIEILRNTILPIAFFLFVPVIAGVATRDDGGNVFALLFSAPLVHRNYVVIKFVSAFLVLLLLSVVPVIRLLSADPFGALALVIGLLFVSSSATFLGRLTGSPKAFAVVFLLFLYIAGSSRGEPAFDFAGWWGLATPGILGGYTAASMLMILTAMVKERFTGE